MCANRHEISAQARDFEEELLLLLPDNVFVVPPVDQRSDFALVVGAEEGTAFHALDEENIAGFGNELLAVTALRCS